MAFHRTIVSVLIAVTTVMALLYLSTFERAADGAAAPSYLLESTPQPQPEGRPRQTAPRHPENRSAFA